MKSDLEKVKEARELAGDASQHIYEARIEPKGTDLDEADAMLDDIFEILDDLMLDIQKRERELKKDPKLEKLLDLSTRVGQAYRKLEDGNEQRVFYLLEEMDRLSKEVLREEATEEVIEKEVKFSPSSHSSAYIYLPKKYAGMEVEIRIPEEVNEDGD